MVNQYFEVNLEKERVFADVHFTLFFVAIINALIGCLIYFLAMRVAENTWVKMEALDTNHYIAIRQQYDQVRKQMKNIRYDAAVNAEKKNRKSSDNSSVSTSSLSPGEIESESYPANQTPTFSSLSSNSKEREKNFVSTIGALLEKPANTLSFGQHNLLKGILQKKHDELLVQLRFHDLRVHFIETHDLPSNFR